MVCTSVLLLIFYIECPLDPLWSPTAASESTRTQPHDLMCSSECPREAPPSLSGRPPSPPSFPAPSPGPFILYGSISKFSTLLCSQPALHLLSLSLPLLCDKLRQEAQRRVANTVIMLSRLCIRPLDCHLCPLCMALLFCPAVPLRPDLPFCPAILPCCVPSFCPAVSLVLPCYVPSPCPAVSLGRALLCAFALTCCVPSFCPAVLPCCVPSFCPAVSLCPALPCVLPCNVPSFCPAVLPCCVPLLCPAMSLRFALKA